MARACLGKRACRAEGRRRRVPDLRRGQDVAAAVEATDDEDAAVGQERGGVPRAGLRERACPTERVGARIPDRRRGESVPVDIPAADDEDAAVSQERGGVTRACHRQRARRAERAGRRIPDLRRGEYAVEVRVTRERARMFAGASATDDEDAAVRQERGGMRRACLGERACRAEGVGHGIPNLRRVHGAIAAVATDDEDAAVGQERGGVVVACPGERACRAEHAAPRWLLTGCERSS